MPSPARGVRWCCFAALSLACGQSGEQGPPSGTSGTAGTGAGAASAGTGGAGGAGGASTGGSSTAGSADGGTAAGTGGSAGKGSSAGGSAGTGGAAGTGTGGKATAGDAGGPEAGTGGDAGTSSGTGGSGGGVPGVPPLTSYAPLGEPITLSGIVNASDIAWKPSTDTFFLLTDRTTTFHEYPATFGDPVRTITLVNSPVDAEGLAYLGQSGGLDRFALGVEANADEVLIFELDPEATTLDFATAVIQTYVPGAEPTVANKGWEGIAYRPAANGEPAWLWACQEGEPGQVPIRVVGFEYQPGAAATLRYDDTLAVEEPWNAADKLGAVAGDLSGLVHDPDSDTLLVLSHLGSRVLRVDPATGDILDTLVLDRSPQYEGITLAGGGRLVVVSEPNFVEIFQLSGN